MNTTEMIRCQLRVCVAVAALIVFSVSGLAQTPPPQHAEGGEGPVNTTCPVTPGEPVDPRFTVEYEGVLIGLCCRRCRTRFSQDPQAYIGNLSVSFAAQDVDQDGHEHADHPEHTEHARELPGHEPHDEAPSPTDAHGRHVHDHAHDTAGRSRLAVWIGRFHPPATHFPIALLFAALLAELALIATGKVRFRHTVGFCLVLASAGAVVAALLGWFNAGFVLWDEDWVLATHRWLGTGTAALSLLTLALFARATSSTAPPRAVVPYRIVLILTVVLVGVTGFLGGSLVHGLDHLAWR